jgi:hypothetical protein
MLQTLGGITLQISFFTHKKQPWPGIKAAAVNNNAFPHFHMLSDNGIAALFLETVADNPEDAWAFVSRAYAGTLDLEALHNVLLGEDAKRIRVCPYMINATYEAEPKNLRIRSVMVMDPERKVKRLLHLHMIKEPDKYGQWKIYGVEQE